VRTVALSQFTALEATQGQMDGFFSQLPYKRHLEGRHQWEIDLRFSLNSTPGWIWTRQRGEPELCLSPNLTDRYCESSSESSANPGEAALGRGCHMPADPLARTLAPRGPVRLEGVP